MSTQWAPAASRDRRFEVRNTVTVEEHVATASVHLLARWADAARVGFVVGEVVQRKQAPLGRWAAALTFRIEGEGRHAVWGAPIEHMRTKFDSPAGRAHLQSAYEHRRTRVWQPAEQRNTPLYPARRAIANAQWQLFTLVHNIEKIAHRTERR